MSFANRNLEYLQEDINWTEKSFCKGQSFLKDIILPIKFPISPFLIGFFEIFVELLRSNNDH